VKKHLDEENVRYVIKSIEADNVTDSTINYALNINANMISIMTEQEISAKNLLLGPYAQQMVNHSPIPVLSIHPQDLLDSLSR
jgi:nucleotide-binding universal stress UspA family protein